MKAIAAIAACALLAACVSPSSYSSSGSLSTPYEAVDLSAPTIKDDSYSPNIQVRATGAKRGQMGLGKGMEFWGLYANINRKSGATVTYVQWGEVYWDSAWRFYSRASTKKGQALSFDNVERDVTKCSSGSCIYSETYNVMIPATELRAGGKDGIGFKIYGRNGDERVVNIPAAIVEQFNTKVAEAQKMRTKA